MKRFVRSGQVWRINKRWDRPGYSAAFRVLRVNKRGISIQHLGRDIQPFPRPDNMETWSFSRWDEIKKYWQLIPNISGQPRLARKETNEETK